jgi:hypothetical protein
MQEEVEMQAWVEMVRGNVCTSETTLGGQQHTHKKRRDSSFSDKKRLEVRSKKKMWIKSRSKSVMMIRYAVAGFVVLNI